MSVSKKETKRVTVQTLQAMKAKGEKITMLTAYDYTMAKIIDGAGIDIILVGDSAANVMAGYETTLPMTLEAMIYHASAVVRACSRALVVADLPFGTYQSDPQRALDSAIKMIKESGAQAVKLEGGREIGEGIRRILDAGIPVIGHLGLTPQSINKFGGYGLRAKEDAEAQRLKEDALYLQELGCSAIVLEKIPSLLAKEVTQSLSIPTIGIGAGSDVDGQVLVSQDFFGMFVDYKPKFVRQYLNLHEQMTKAVIEYINDVKSVSFPNENEQY
nr:3-methyl-2-oxobutanoate hydroxymethyltransferase [uncultured Capnocytophaga sp.]